MRNLVFLVLLLTVCASLAAPARADDAQKYLLGTTLVLTSPTQLPMPSSGYWGDLTPIEYRFGQCYIVDAINAARQARGVTEMVDVSKYPIALGSEMSTDAGWEYTIDFAWMQPADVDAALAKFPMSGALAGLPHSYRGVSYGSFYADSQDDTLTLSVLGSDMTVSRGDSISAISEKLTARLTQLFGPTAKFDISVSSYSSAYNGSNSFNVSVSVYLDDSAMQYGDEHGEA